MQAHRPLISHRQPALHILDAGAILANSKHLHNGSNRCLSAAALPPETSTAGQDRVCELVQLSGRRLHRVVALHFQAAAMTAQSHAEQHLSAAALTADTSTEVQLGLPAAAMTATTG